MIEIYKTNVKTRRQASQIIGLLQNSFSKISINFDLQDWDKVLRVEGIKPADTTKVISDLIRLGFTCEILN